MKKRSFFFSMIILVMVLSVLACNLPTAGSATPTSQVIVVTATPRPETVLPTTVPASPTATSLPATATTVPTATPVPCNQVSFVSDVTVPDGTVFVTGKSFTKTWRLKNTGSCTWTSGYQLVFANGDQMAGPASQPLTGGTVAPNDTMDVSVNLTAPAAAGTYRGYWKIREPGGATFGLSTGAFWVEIKVEAPTATVTATVTPAPTVTATVTATPGP